MYAARTAGSLKSRLCVDAAHERARVGRVRQPERVTQLVGEHLVEDGLARRLAARRRLVRRRRGRAAVIAPSAPASTCATPMRPRASGGSVSTDTCAPSLDSTRAKTATPSAVLRHPVPVVHGPGGGGVQGGVAERGHVKRERQPRARVAFGAGEPASEAERAARRGGASRSGHEHASHTATLRPSPIDFRAERRASWAAMNKPSTVRELRQSGYRPKSVKQELRDNLITRSPRASRSCPASSATTTPSSRRSRTRSCPDRTSSSSASAGRRRRASRGSSWGCSTRRCPSSRAARSTTIRSAPICPACRARVDGRLRGRVAAARPALRGEARDARHLHRGPHRRGRSDQGGRGPLSLRRADDPLRAPAAHAPRDLRAERAARPRRAHPGRPAQHHGRARRADPRLQGAAAARPLRRRERQPRGLHEPRAHHHAAQGPLRLADPHALPEAPRPRDRDHGAERTAFAADGIRVRAPST